MDAFNRGHGQQGMQQVKGIETCQILALQAGAKICNTESSSG